MEKKYSWKKISSENEAIELLPAQYFFVHESLIAIKNWLTGRLIEFLISVTGKTRKGVFKAVHLIQSHICHKFEFFP